MGLLTADLKQDRGARHLNSKARLPAPVKCPRKHAHFNQIMKIWTSEHIFNHNWETVTIGQWQKYPNPINQAVVGTDVVDRKVVDGVLHSHRIISSDWGLAEWVQRLVGANKVCYASEISMVDPKNRLMEMHSKNLSFSNFVNMEEKMTYTPDPLDCNKTLLRQETVVTVQGVPLTSYMEGIIVNTVSNNSSKGKAAIEWVVDKLETEILDLKYSVAESLILPAKKSIEGLQQDLAKIELSNIKLDLPLPQPPSLKAEEHTSTAPTLGQAGLTDTLKFGSTSTK